MVLVKVKKMSEYEHCEDCESKDVEISELEQQVSDLTTQYEGLEVDIEDLRTIIRTINDYLSDAENTSLDTVSTIQAAMRET